MRTTVFVLMSAWLLLGTAAARADAQPPNSEAQALAKSFAKVCMLAVPDSEKVVLQAKIEDWQRIEGPEIEPVVTAKSNPTRSSWVTKGVAGLPIAVTIARAPDLDLHRLVQICAIENPQVSPAGLRQALTDVLSLPAPEAPKLDGDKKITAWRIHFGNRIVDIGLVEQGTDKPGVVVNAVILDGLPP